MHRRISLPVSSRRRAELVIRQEHFDDLKAVIFTCNVQRGEPSAVRLNVRVAASEQELDDFVATELCGVVYRVPSNVIPPERIELAAV